MVDQPTVVVRGEAVHEVAPELARVAVSVAARDKDRAAVLSRLTERAAALRELLDGFGAGIERRETGGVHVWPELKRGSERVVAYSGSVSTTVTVGDFSMLGDLVLQLAGQDQASVSGPWWELRPNSPVTGAARRAAIGDAVQRAREYAAAVGARIDRLIEIADEGGDAPTPMRAMAYKSARVADAAPELEIDPQVQTVHAAVRVRFAITEPTDLGDEQHLVGEGEPFTV
jgi:uncharacterized protein YggE